MPHRKLVRDSVGFVVTQYVVRVALMLRGLIALRLMTPYSYGAWNALSLILDYGALAPLSTQAGLDQAVPGRIVSGPSAALDRLKRAGLFNIVLLTGLFAVASVGYLSRHQSQLHTYWGSRGLVLAAATVALINLSNYHLTLLRSHGRIGAVSMWFVLQAGVGTVLGLGLIPWLDAWGLLAGWLAGTALGVSYVRAQGRGLVPIVPRASEDCGLLLRVGLPMYLYTASSTVMRSLDRLVILRFLGTMKLGYYSLSVMVLGLLLYLPDSVSYVLYPYFLRRYHSAGDDPAAIRGTAVRSLQVLAVVMPGLCGLLFLVARDGAALLLPHYLPGIRAARIMCFAAGAIALANVSSVLLMTLGRSRWLVTVAGIVTVLGAGVDYTVVRLGYDISGVAWATLGIFTVAGLLMPWLALTGLGFATGERLAWLGRFMAPLALSLALSFSIDRLLPWAHVPGAGVRIARMALATLTFGAVFTLGCVPFVRSLGLRQLMGELNLRLPFLGGRPPGKPDA